MKKIIPAIALSLTVFACETPNIGGYTYSDGSEGADVYSSGQDAGLSTYQSGDLDGGYGAQGYAIGGQEDLVANVGDTILFGYDSASLNDEAKMILRNQAEWLKQYSDVNVIIEGHTDERGTREYNIALGAKRANAVKNYLVRMGVSRSRIDTLSFGKERPAVEGTNAQAWGFNRRAHTRVR